MVLIAGVFVAVEGVAYFAFMAAWLNLFLLIGVSRIIQLLLGAIAALLMVATVAARARAVLIRFDHRTAY